MFCYFCQTDWKKMEIISGCGAGIGFPFILVFSPDALQQVQDAQTERECSCPSEYVYDTYKKICRKLTCSNGKVLSGNRCVTTIKSSFGFAYSVSLRLETTLHSDSRLFPSSDNEFKTIALNVRNVFEDKVYGEHKIQSNIPQFVVHTFLTLIRGNTTVSIDVFSKVKSNDNIMPSEFEKRLLILNNADWNIETPDDGNVTFKSKLVPGLPEDTISMAPQNDVRRGLVGAPNGTIYEFRMIDIPDIASISRWTVIPQTTKFTEVKNTLDCARFVFNLTEDDDVTLIKNDSWSETGLELVHEASGVRLSFLDISIVDSDIVLACAEEIMKEMEKNSQQEDSDVDAIEIFGAGLVVTSHVCLTISALTLFLTFLTYCIFPPLRTLPGKCTMALVFTLFMAIVLFQVGGSITEVTAACQTVGVVTHFFLLSSFTWMVICTFHMYRVFAHLMDHAPDDENHYLRLFRYAIISIIVPSLVVAVTIVTNHVINTNNNDDNRDEVVNVTDTHSNDQFTLPRSCEVTTRSTIGYGDGVCYVSNKYSLVFASALPIILLCVANLAMFVMTLCSLRKMTSQQKMVNKDAQSNIFIYVKLSSLTGINWIPCTIAAFVSSPVVWYIFLILTGLQGLYVFVSFVLNKRVLKMYRQLFRKRTTSLDAKTATSHDPNRSHRYQVRHENGDTHSDDIKTLSTDSAGGMPAVPDAIKQNGRAETAIAS